MEWRKLDNIIEEKLKDVLAKIEESDKNSSWYSVLNKIYDTYTFKFTGEDWWHYWRKGDYLPKQLKYLPCIICNQKENCLEQSEPIITTFTLAGEEQKKQKKKRKKNI